MSAVAEILIKARNQASQALNAAGNDMQAFADKTKDSAGAIDGATKVMSKALRGDLVGAFKDAVKAWKSMGAAFAANPFGAAIAAATVLVGVITKLVGKYREAKEAKEAFELQQAEGAAKFEAKMEEIRNGTPAERRKSEISKLVDESNAEELERRMKEHQQRQEAAQKAARDYENERQNPRYRDKQVWRSDAFSPEGGYFVTEKERVRTAEESANLRDQSAEKAAKEKKIVEEYAAALKKLREADATAEKASDSAASKWSEERDRVEHGTPEQQRKEEIAKLVGGRNTGELQRLRDESEQSYAAELKKSDEAEARRQASTGKEEREEAEKQRDFALERAKAAKDAAAQYQKGIEQVKEAQEAEKDALEKMLESAQSRQEAAERALDAAQQELDIRGAQGELDEAREQKAAADDYVSRARHAWKTRGNSGFWERHEEKKQRAREQADERQLQRQLDRWNKGSRDKMATSAHEYQEARDAQEAAKQAEASAAKDLADKKESQENARIAVLEEMKEQTTKAVEQLQKLREALIGE